MVSLENLGTNVVKVWVGDKTILFSYDTPVAVWVRGDGVKRYAIKEKLSATTSKHLNQHGPERYLLEGDHFEKVTANELLAIIGG